MSDSLVDVIERIFVILHCTVCGGRENKNSIFKLFRSLHLSETLVLLVQGSTSIPTFFDSHFNSLTATMRRNY